MAVTVRETESKFAVSEGFEVPDLVSVGQVTEVVGPDALVLSAVYYDTADLRLAREGITLRRRTGGHDAGWHLKLPVGGSTARDEVRLPLSAGGGDRVPADLEDLVTVFARGRALRPVATLRTARTVHLLRAADGRDLAEVALDDVSVLPLGTDATPHAREQGSFRELELEVLGDGAHTGEAGLDAVVRALTAAGATPTGELVPKVVRALGTAAAAAPDVPAPPRRFPASAPAADLVRAHVATQVRALRSADLGVRRGEEDAVHQLRVAARRLRSGLRVFRPLLERGWADDLRAELAWVAGELGGARDAEVLAARLQAAVEALPDEVDAAAAGAVLRRRLGRGAADGRADALSAVRGERYLRLVDRLVEAAARPATTPAAARPCREVLPPLVARALRRLAREADALRLDGPDDDWHEVRKSAKAARYAAEAVRPAVGTPAKRLARQVERVTELLGEHQDAAVAATALARLAATPRTAARTAFALGVLHAGQRQEVRAAREDFLRAWPRVADRRHRQWLR